MSAALDAILVDDNEYRRRALAVGRLVRSAPFTPAEIFVRTVEFSARVGIDGDASTLIAALQPGDANRGLVVEHHLDVVAICCLFLLVVGSLLIVGCARAIVVGMDAQRRVRTKIE